MPLLTRNSLRLTEWVLPLARLPQGLAGLRIAQISDLHFYEYTDSAYYERVLQAVNAAKPDVIVMTGDVIHYGPDFVDTAGAFLSRLEAKEAKLGILGNHDYNDGANGDYVAAMLDDSGFRLLKNTNVCLERAGERLWFAGLDDLWYGHPDIPAALHGIPTEEDVTVVLAHNPLLFDPIALAGLGRVDLVIAGHTHAGHVYIPVLGPIYRKIFRMKYRYGLFEKQGCRLHVSSGVGSAAFYLKKRKIGFPRFRFNTWPEIALLTLVRE
jgi:predicted MPP superfamily phosphohydrolase